MKLAMLNTTIATTNGVFKITDLSLEQARQLAMENKDNILSAIGHEATAQVMTTLLGVEVPTNRIVFAQEKGQKAIVLKMNGRIPEGVVLTVEDMEKIEYSFKLMEKLED